MLIEEYLRPPEEGLGDVFGSEATRVVCMSIKNILLQSPSTLDHLIFNFKLRQLGEGSAGQLLDSFGWDELEQLVARCHEMRRVTFRFVGRPDGDKFLQGAIKRRLFNMHALGVLKIEFRD